MVQGMSFTKQNKNPQFMLIGRKESSCLSTFFKICFSNYCADRLGNLHEPSIFRSSSKRLADSNITLKKIIATTSQNRAQHVQFPMQKCFPSSKVYVFVMILNLRNHDDYKHMRCLIQDPMGICTKPYSQKLTYKFDP